MSDAKKMPVNQDSPLTPDQRTEIAKPIEEVPPAHHGQSVTGTETEHIHEKKESAPAPKEADEVDEEEKEAAPVKKAPPKPAKKDHK